MMLKRALFSLALFLPLAGVHAQINQPSPVRNDILQSLKNYHDRNTSISIYLDPLIEANYYKHILYNQKNQGVTGYQLRIFSGSGPRAKEEAEKARSRFLSKFENIGAYLVYDTPDYKVYVGDCRTKSEVLKLIDMIKADFPNAFQVSRKISVSYK